jgi:hypothetical protein
MQQRAALQLVSKSKRRYGPLGHDGLLPRARIDSRLLPRDLQRSEQNRGGPSFPGTTPGFRSPPPVRFPRIRKTTSETAPSFRNRV